MKPSDYKAGGTNSAILFAVGECSLGSILVAQSSRGVCAILLGDEPDTNCARPARPVPNADLVDADHNFEQLIAHVGRFHRGTGPRAGFAVGPARHRIQQRVWQALRDIPVGHTAQLRVNRRAHWRAQAASALRPEACGANRSAVAIPCHRVVRSNGDLSGYRSGVERKQQLLDRERDH